MISKILEMLTGKDDVERVACKGDRIQLSTYLKTRSLFIPKRPSQFLDADNYTKEELLKLIETEANDLSKSQFEPWILEADGVRRLPAFSSLAKMEAFSVMISENLNKVFASGYIKILLPDIPTGWNIDFVDLNLFSKKSWEIGM